MLTRRELHLMGAAAWSRSKDSLPWGDTSRLGRPFAKDPSVIRWNGSYRLYYSMPGGSDGMVGWAIGVAESADRVQWRKVGEILPEHPYEAKGLAAPGGAGMAKSGAPLLPDLRERAKGRDLPCRLQRWSPISQGLR